MLLLSHLIVSRLISSHLTISGCFSQHRFTSTCDLILSDNIVSYHICFIATLQHRILSHFLHRILPSSSRIFSFFCILLLRFISQSINHHRINPPSNRIAAQCQPLTTMLQHPPLTSERTREHSRTPNRQRTNERTTATKSNYDTNELAYYQRVKIRQYHIYSMLLFSALTVSCGHAAPQPTAPQ